MAALCQVAAASLVTASTAWHATPVCAGTRMTDHRGALRITAHVAPLPVTGEVVLRTGFTRTGAVQVAPAARRPR